MGWSESAQRVRAFFSTAATDFSPQYCDHYTAPAFDLELVPKHDLGGPLTWSYPPTSLLRILKMQRAEAAAGTGESFGFIGGAATLTTLTRDRIEQRVLHRWS